MRALRRNVQGELGQEFQRVEDLEVPLRPALQTIPLRPGKRPTGVLLGLADHLPGLAHLDQPGKIEAGGSGFLQARVSIGKVTSIVRVSITSAIGNPI